MAKSKSKPLGYLYRGANRVVETGIYRIRLVQDETYVIPFLDRINEGELEVILKKPGASIRISISLSDYYLHISSGRTSFKDDDPY